MVAIRSRSSSHLLRPGTRSNQSTIAASYDAADTTPHNRRHWQFSDDRSADESARPEIRRTLRNRARYEILRNSSIGSGMVQMLALDTVGSEIKLVMGLENEADNRSIQSAMADWIEAIDLVTRLRTAKIDKTVSGETMFRIVTNTRLDSEVQLDLMPLECDHLCAASVSDDHRPDYVDGVHLDRLKNPISYDVLREHPGSWFGGSQWAYDTFDHSQVIHWFRQDRPQQHRGVSEVCSALPLFAHRRRFQLATISAAETAANRATVITTDLEPSDAISDAVDEFAARQMLGSIELDRNSSTVLPHGYKIGQQSAEHPVTTFEMFDRAIVMELSRCVLMPYETISGNHAGLSFSGGRLSRSGYERAVAVERVTIRRKILDRLLSEWLYEAALIDLLPTSVSETVLDIARRVGVSAIARRVPHSFFFDGFQEADAAKAATAQRTRLQSGMSDRASEYAARGIDWEEADEKAAKTFGYKTVGEYRQAVGASIFSNGNQLAESTGAQDVLDQLDEIENASTEQLVGAA